MDDLYQWLYDHYALPELKDIMSGQDDVLSEYAARASKMMEFEYAAVLRDRIIELRKEAQ